MEGLDVNPGFWATKRVLITGHTGFKGSWLSLWLQSMGAQITGFSLPPPTTPSLFVEAQVEEGMTHVLGDIRNLEDLQSAIHKSKPEVIFHMAAQPLVRHSYVDPVETYSTNVMGTVNLLEAVRRCNGVRAVVNVTSDKCYANKEWERGYVESDAMGGHDPYSSSKGCAELVSAAYTASFFNPADYQSHGVAVASARAGNVIGGGDWAKDRLIPDVIKSFTSDKALAIRNPEAIRPWQHVLEPLRGYIGLAEELYEQGPSFAEAWNFGPTESDTRPVEWIVQTMANLWHEPVSWSVEKREQPHEAQLLKLDVSKAARRLNWNPSMNLNMALQYTIKWNQDWRNGENMRRVTLCQIESYQISINNMQR
jgi:CDP-glucose 4,6-dehydratase